MKAEELFLKSCKELGIAVGTETYAQFYKYQKLLDIWNQKMNLTAITEEIAVVQKHFIDSLSITVAFCPKKGESVIDVGTGAGFPGLPLKLVFPFCKLTLMDAQKKRISFLNAVVEELQLTDVFCVHARAEEAGQNQDYREGFDYCVSRAVAALPVLAEYCLPFVRQGGSFLALKGPGIANEAKQAEEAVRLLGGRISKILPVTIPFSEYSHTIVLIEKICATPQKYPRKAGRIIKNPL